MKPVIVGTATLYLADCIEAMRTMPDNSVDSVVTDPPYGIRFMGKAWDGEDIEARTERRRGFASHAPNAGPSGGHKSIAAEAGKYDLTPTAMRAFQEFSEEWAREALRVLKPGGHLLSFSSARTYHRMVSGIEDAGFEIRDRVLYVRGDGEIEEHFPVWVFGSGFPKSLNVAKAIQSGGGRPEDIRRMQMGEQYEASGRGRANYDHGAASAMGGEAVAWAPASDAAAQWDGWGTALKPAHEPICVARKPLAKGMTVAANVLLHGTGGLNIDACRVEPTGESSARIGEASQEQRYTDAGGTDFAVKPGMRGGAPEGRWPANLIHDGSAEVVSLFPAQAGASAPVRGTEASAASVGRVTGERDRVAGAFHADTGSAARFFYCAKASRADRNAGLIDPGPQFKQGTTLRKVETTATTGNTHPTVKPTDLMAYLCRLVTPPGGIVLDPFMGSGSTGKAAMREGFRFIGIDMSEEYFPIAAARIEHEIAVVAAAALVAADAAATSPQIDLFAEVQP